MGVYIKGMKMPKGCHETTHGYICPYLLYCKVNRKYVEKTGRAAINKRLDGCPLVEVAEPRWIPVTEMSPKAECGESDSVLVCFENKTQDILYFDGGNWCYPTGETYISVNHKSGWHNRVVAWRPLPEPYKESEE